MIEQLEIQHAELRTALAQEPNLLNGLNGNQRLEVEALLDDLALYAVTSDEKLVGDIGTKLNRLETRFGATSTLQRQLAQLVQMVLDNKPAADELVTQVFELPLTTNMRALEQPFEDIQQDTRSRIALYRILIYVLSFAGSDMVAI